MNELIAPEIVNRVLLFLAVGGPLVGLVLGSLLGTHERRALPRIVAGVLVGAVFTLVYGLWHVFNAITGAFGLDSLANLGMQLLLFAVFGSLLGLAILKISTMLRNSAHAEDR